MRKTPYKNAKKFRFYLILGIVFWTLMLGGSLYWNLYQAHNETYRLAEKDAIANFNKDQAFRFWASKHGGIYVKTDERTPSNPNLSHIPDRDIVTASGTRLTLMNPAYMVRQLMGEFPHKYGVQGRIVSDKPLYAPNAPDPWEAKAIEAFKKGAKEVKEYVEIEGEPFLRLMRPMMIAPHCLKCHAHQGYAVGDVRGGVGVNVSLVSYFEDFRDAQVRLTLSHLLLYLFGLGLIIFSAIKIRNAIEYLEESREEVRRSEAKFVDLYDNSPDMYVSVDAQSAQIKQCNRTLADKLGYTKEEIIGRPIFEVYHPDCMPDVKRAFEGFVKTGEVHDTELQLMRKDGSKIDVALNVTSVRDDAGRVLYSRSCWVDISELKKAQHTLEVIQESLEETVKMRTEELLNANQKLKEMDRLKSMFIASMSHELRTPLNSIIGFTGVMRKGMTGELTEKQMDYLTRVENAGQHLLRLVADVIDVSKIEAGRTEPYCEGFMLNALLQEAVDESKVLAKQKGLEVLLEVHDDVEMYTDRSRLFQCLLNYLGNAVKFSETGTITLGAIRRGEQVKITVADMGIGIAESDKPKLFEAFERLETHLRVKEGGSGLGLYLTKKIVTELLQGTVGFESVLNQGSSFWLLIPVEATEPDEEKAVT